MGRQEEGVGASWDPATLRLQGAVDQGAGTCTAGGGRAGCTDVGVVSQHENFQSAPGSRVGTPAYLAPEVILTTKGKTYNAKVGLQCGGRTLSTGHHPPSPSPEPVLPSMRLGAVCWQS